jgi:hypothetical protein
MAIRALQLAIPEAQIIALSTEYIGRLNAAFAEDR